MKCPTCDNVHLTRQERLGISFTQCPQCRGVWLARETLAELQEHTGLFLKQGKEQKGTREGAVGMKRPLWQVLFEGNQES